MKRPSARALPIPRGMTVADFNAALRRQRAKERIAKRRAKPAVKLARAEYAKRWRDATPGQREREALYAKRYRARKRTA